MTTNIILKRDTSYNWDIADPVLSAGEVGYETDTNLWKWGDGTTSWHQLSYVLPTKRMPDVLCADFVDSFGIYTSKLTADQIYIGNDLFCQSVIRGAYGVYTSSVYATAGGVYAGTLTSTTVSSTNISSSSISATTVQGGTLCGTTVASAANVAITYTGGGSACLSGGDQVTSADRFLQFTIDGQVFYVPAFASAGAFTAV